MTRLKQILAVLLTVLLLSGASAVAEPAIEPLCLEEAGSSEPDVVRDALDLPLAGPEGLSLSGGLEPVSIAPEPAAASANVAPAAGEDPFDIDDQGVLVRYTGSNSAVTVPDVVTKIGKNAFKGNGRLTSVTIPAGVVAIQAKAFSGCGKLSTVNVLAGDISIASNAFSGAKPTFCTVIGSSAARWARKQGFEVEDNLVVPGKNTRMEAGIGDTLRIFTSGERAISFFSSNTTVATVTKQGVISVLNGGTTQITTWLESWTPLYLTLSVPYPKARLSEKSVTLNAGGSKTLTIDNLSGRTVSWFSSNISVATVRGGLVIALRPGESTVTAALSDGTSLKCKVTVRDAARLSRSKLSLKAGFSGKLTVVGLAGRTATWTSSNSGVASVVAGKVSAHKAGSCTVTAQIHNGAALRCKVTVREAAKLSRTSLSLKVGETYKLTVTNHGDRTVTWTSGNSGIASVKAGKVSAHKAGSCTITARLSGGKTLTCRVTVNNK